jgi:hypothetical protein
MKISKKYFDYIVVGTGLSSYPAVYELLKKKKNFAVLDIGFDINKETSSFYYDKTWKQISKNKNEIIKKLNYLQSLGKTSKLSYGSDHSYSSLEKNFSKFESKSLGGFSNNWGSVLYIYNKKEIKNWPLIPNEIYKNINEIANIFNLDQDNLKQLLNYNDIIDKQKKFNFFKNSVLAVTGCKSRSLCMYGCPERAILNSKDLFLKLINNNKINYYNKIKVEKIYQKKDLVLSCYSIKNKKKIFFSCKKVFLATGALSTSKILLNSFAGLNELELRDSSMFFFPIINIFKRENKIGKQLCSSIFKYQSGNHNFYIQIYNDINFFLFRFPKFIRFIFNDILKVSLAIGYLSSKDSSFLKIIKIKNYFSFKIIKKKNFFKRIYYTFIFLFKNISQGLLVIPFLQFKFKDFSSYHFGSSVPMIKKRDKMPYIYCNKNGELNLCKKIILLDSSNFTNIQPGPISLMSMLNSLRIVKIILRDKKI